MTYMKKRVGKQATYGSPELLVGVLAPLFLLAYGILSPLYGTVLGGHTEVASFIIFMLSWIAVGIWRGIIRETSGRIAVALLVTHHVFALTYLSSFVEISPIIIPAWILLALASFNRFGMQGFTVSLGILVFAVTIGISANDYSYPQVASMYMSVVVTAFIAGSVVRLSALDSAGHEEAAASRRRETLEHERLLTIINNLADAIFVTDKSGKISTFNAASLSLLDTNESIAGKRLGEVFHLQDADGIQTDLFTRIRNAKSVTVDDSLRVVTETDTMRIEFTYAPIRSGYAGGPEVTGHDGFIIIARDVTRLKSLEEERDEFISVVSHELRTPITVTEGTISNVQLMYEKDRVDTVKIKDSLEAAHQQVIYLAKMINDLSTLSRAERGVMAETEVIDVADLVHDLYAEYVTEAKKQSLAFNLELGSKLGNVSCSRLYLHELLQNFITNAIKYTKEGSVTLTVSLKAGVVTFAVSDTGIGISKSDQAKVFDKFYRSEDYRTRETGGTGLGLYVATKLAKKLGTKIELRSRLNHGSTFSFTLPTSNVK
jgi:PAS domain S-box-containing protein